MSSAAVIGRKIVSYPIRCIRALEGRREGDLEIPRCREALACMCSSRCRAISLSAAGTWCQRQPGRAAPGRCQFRLQNSVHPFARCARSWMPSVRDSRAARGWQCDAGVNPTGGRRSDFVIGSGARFVQWHPAAGRWGECAWRGLRALCNQRAYAAGENMLSFSESAELVQYQSAGIGAR